LFGHIRLARFASKTGKDKWLTPFLKVYYSIIKEDDTGVLRQIFDDPLTGRGQFGCGGNRWGIHPWLCEPIC
jgi:hypothetical protein